MSTLSRLNPNWKLAISLYSNLSLNAPLRKPTFDYIIRLNSVEHYRCIISLAWEIQELYLSLSHNNELTHIGERLLYDNRQSAYLNHFLLKQLNKSRDTNEQTFIFQTLRDTARMLLFLGVKPTIEINCLVPDQYNVSIAVIDAVTKGI